MGDWADEVVKSLHPMWTMTHAAPRIAADLRKARHDALEEAERAVALLRFDETEPYDGWTLGKAVVAIRDLKDKP